MIQKLRKKLMAKRSEVTSNEGYKVSPVDFICDIPAELWVEILFNWIDDWISFALFDMALCNKAHRKVYLSWIYESQLSLSSLSLSRPLSQAHKLEDQLRWLNNRQLTGKHLNVRFFDPSSKLKLKMNWSKLSNMVEQISLTNDAYEENSLLEELILQIYPNLHTFSYHSTLDIDSFQQILLQHLCNFPNLKHLHWKSTSSRLFLQDLPKVSLYCQITTLHLQSMLITEVDVLSTLEHIPLLIDFSVIGGNSSSIPIIDHHDLLQKSKFIHLEKLSLTFSYKKIISFDRHTSHPEGSSTLLGQISGRSPNLKKCYFTSKNYNRWNLWLLRKYCPLLKNIEFHSIIYDSESISDRYNPDEGLPEYYALHCLAFQEFTKLDGPLLTSLTMTMEGNNLRLPAWEPQLLHQHQQQQQQHQTSHLYGYLKTLVIRRLAIHTQSDALLLRAFFSEALPCLQVLDLTQVHVAEFAVMSERAFPIDYLEDWKKFHTITSKSLQFFRFNTTSLVFDMTNFIIAMTTMFTSIHSLEIQASALTEAHLMMLLETFHHHLEKLAFNAVSYRRLSFTGNAMYPFTSLFRQCNKLREVNLVSINHNKIIDFAEMLLAAPRLQSIVTNRTMKEKLLPILMEKRKSIKLTTM
jgi:hypothetical protein